MDDKLEVNDDTKKEGSRLNFIEQQIEEDIKNGKYDGKVKTRWPPEPNGYIHIGHAKAITINFEIAKKYNGYTHLRFDDTNPIKEDIEYVEAIQKDIKWLGYDWGAHLYHASDYFDKLYEYAIKLIKKGKAYVDDLSAEETSKYRGTPTEPGKNSPYRERSVEENLNLFERMKKGEFKDGEKTLRAKIDMSAGNMNMRDPVMYRIKHTPHHRTGDKWCIYPTYDWAHGQSDSIEEITHSLCSLEFEIHRPLYSWFIEQLEIYPSRQIEFSKLFLTNTVLGKRHLINMVKEGIVRGWDDPRMPTISGLRRRGYTPEAIRNFLMRIGVAKTNSMIDYSLLEHFIREDLNTKANRVMGVLRPLKVIIDNYPDDKEEYIEAENNPENPEAGNREIPFSKEIYIENDDFVIDPPKKYFRLSPGKEIRLKHAYYIKCVSYEQDKETGEVICVHCTYDPSSKGGWTEDGRKIKGTSHWVSVKHAIDAEVRLYDYLFSAEVPGEKTGNYIDDLNPDSLEILNNCKVEPSLLDAKIMDKFQFLRMGYFCVDPDSTKEKLVFNRTVGLKDSWAKITNKK